MKVDEYIESIEREIAESRNRSNGTILKFRQKEAFLRAKLYKSLANLINPKR